MKRLRLIPEEPWQRNQYVMVAMVFMVFTGFAFVLPFLPLYIRELGVEDPAKAAAWAGVLIGVAPLLAGALAPVWGRLGDRHGQKRMALRALGSYVILLLLSAIVTRVEQLLLLRIGIGLFGGVGPLGLAMATSASPREHTGRAVGSVQAAQILSAAVGPLAGGILADLIGIRWTFVATAVLCAGALGLVARYYQDAPRPAGGDQPARAGFADILRVPGVLSLLVVLFLVNFVGRSFTPVLPFQLQTMSVPLSRIAVSTGALISVYSAAAALSATALGKASGQRSPRALLVASLLGGAVTVVPMALIDRFSLFLGLGLALGLVSGGALTLCYTMGGLLVPSAGLRATAFGFFAGAALVGGAVSPAVAGLIARWNLRAIYYVDGIIFLGLALALLPGAWPSRVRVASATSVR